MSRRKNRALPDPDLLHTLLTYNPSTGELFWKHRDPSLFKGTRKKKLRTAEHAAKQWNDKYAGTAAFTAKTPRGALCGNLLNKLYLAHRIAYAMHTGEDPGDLTVDHINGDPSDNRAENLRLADQRTQSRNMPKSKTNTSGCVGVGWVKRVEKWEAKIGVGGKTVWLGLYESFDEAVAARKGAESALGFHENHGR
jgi:hypothetical protein